MADGWDSFITGHNRYLSLYTDTELQTFILLQQKNLKDVFKASKESGSWHTHREKERERQTDRQTETETETDRQTDRQTDTTSQTDIDRHREDK